MIRQKHLAIAAAALAAGCAGNPPAPLAAASDRPVFPQYRPADTHRPKLTAPTRGILTQRGPCLGLMVGGRFATVIWPETARLSFDRRGLLLSDRRSGARLRLGDTLQGTGGPLPPGFRQQLGDTVLTEGFHIECARWPGYPGWIAIVNPGFRKAR